MAGAYNTVKRGTPRAVALAVLVLLHAGAAGAVSRQEAQVNSTAGIPVANVPRSPDAIFLAESSDRSISLFEQRRKAQYAQPVAPARPAKQVQRKAKPKPEVRTVKAPARAPSAAAESAVHSLGGYRTMCVRTCDGYYFPISPSSSKGEFKRDQKNCEAMCPGADVQIYYQAASEEAPEAMTSIKTEKPYSELPTAFLYRNASATQPEQCGCNPGKSFAVMASGQQAGGFSSIQGTDETTSQTTTEGSITTLGAVDPTPSAAISSGEPKEPATVLPPPGERKVRVVGPAFLPAQERAIDLRAPAQNSVQ